MERMDVSKEIQEEFVKFEWWIEPLQAEKTAQFKNLADLYNFFDRELNFWSSIKVAPLNQITAFWRQIKSELDQGMANPGQIGIYLKNVYTKVKNGKWPVVVSDSRLGILFKNEQNKGQAYFEGFVHSIAENIGGSLSRPQALKGFVDGQVFQTSEYIADHLKKTTRGIDQELSKLADRKQELDSEHSLLVSELREKYKHESEQLETGYQEKNAEIEDWIKATKDDFSTSNQERTKLFDNLIDLYEKKIQLEAPAKYWANRAGNLRNWGWLWAILSTLTVIGGGVILWQYFINFDTTPEHLEKAAEAAKIVNNDVKSMLISYFSSAKNLKSVVAFAVIVSAYLFLLRTFIKLTLSAFHLSIDAREREQLTYVYLALVQKGQKDDVELIKDREREIILQSLFSRADSGLLKGDSGPTMPGDWSGILSKLGGGH